jgi:hypothetical protein
MLEFQKQEKNKRTPQNSKTPAGMHTHITVGNGIRVPIWVGGPGGRGAAVSM